MNTPTGPTEYLAGSYSDLGGRRHNEDACFVDTELGLYVVADGVGGLGAGEVASAMICEILFREVAAGSDLVGSIRQANREIRQAVSTGRGKPGMAATVVAARSHQNGHEIAWVGDSRAYLWDGKLSQLTRDHSYVQVQLAAGRITPEAARSHPKRNIILQAVGSQRESELEVGCNTVEITSGSSLLLCSDGVSGPLDEEQLSQLLSGGVTPEITCMRLVSLALQCGGRDNATAVLVARAPGQTRGRKSGERSRG